MLLSGISPETDWLKRKIDGEGGLWLADRWKGALVQVRGDWEFHASIFSLPKWNNAVNMCWLCSASADGPLRFTACGAGAAWRDTRRSHESFLLECAANGKEVPVLLAKVQGLRLDCIMIDILHTVDQGVASHVIGNIFFQCVSDHVFGGSNQQENLAILQDRLHAHYKVHKPHSKIQGELTLDRIRTSNGWPKLKAKAAATRHLAGFALQLAREYLDARRVALCTLLCRFYSVIDSEEQFLSAAAKAELPGLGRRMCELYSSLSAEALAAGQKRWKMSPKHHLCFSTCVSGNLWSLVTPSSTGCMRTRT